MSRRTKFLRGMALAGMGTAAAVSARRASDERAAGKFYELPLDHTAPKRMGAAYGGLPIIFHRSESVQTYHTASFDAVRNLLPSPDLHPVRVAGGRTVLFIAALQHNDVTVDGVKGLAALPYGEVMIAALVTRRPAPPFLPLVAPAVSGLGAGAFVLHLPVTSRAARDAGRQVYGYPKFVADMEFDGSPASPGVRLAEGGRDILTLEVHPTGRPAVEDERLTLYSVLEEQLIELKMPVYGFRQTRWGGSAARLQLGDHLIADQLRELSISPRPFLTTRGLAERYAMSTGRPIGPADAYVGYIGEERDLGRYVVRYPNTAPIDRYAPYADTAGPRRTIEEFAPPRELAGIAG